MGEKTEYNVLNLSAIENSKLSTEILKLLIECVLYNEPGEHSYNMAINTLLTYGYITTIKLN